MGDDPPRLLAKASERAYVTYSAGALPGEPEAVNAATQERFSLAAQRQLEEQQRRAWRQAHGQISTALAAFKRNGHLDRRTLSDARAIERTAQRIEKRLGLE